MNRMAILIPLVLGAACSENELRGEEIEGVIPNPPKDGNPTQEDRIIQVQQPQVDVLFVVDNSCSMDEEQRALADNFPDFMNYFVNSGLDYHIGVTSTDMNLTSGAGKLRVVSGTRFLSEETEAPETVFQLMAVMGTGGYFEETGREAAYTLIELRPDFPRNKDFYRDDASLHIIFISDENDRSEANPVGVNEFRQWMRNKKDSPDLVTAHAIVRIQNQEQDCTGDLGSEEPGTLYSLYATSTGGIVSNLCDTDWGPMLDALGLQTAGLKKEYFLSKIPVTNPWSLDVKVITETATGQQVSIEFASCLVGDEETDADCRVTYNPGRNSIVFLDYIPDPFSEVKVRYNIRELFQAI